MDRLELREQYEKETGKAANPCIYAYQEVCPGDGYIKWLEQRLSASPAGAVVELERKPALVLKQGVKC